MATINFQVVFAVPCAVLPCAVLPGAVLPGAVLPFSAVVFRLPWTMASVM
jgi:hypothetical protein